MNNIFQREFERRDNIIITISQLEHGDVGCVVWDAAIVLAHYLEGGNFPFSNEINFWKNKKIIELGAGTGLVGIQAAVSGAHCIITDLPEFIQLMNLNIKNNKNLITGSCITKELKWGCDISTDIFSPDYIFLADCIYYHESLNPLIKTLNDLSSEKTIILCCYEKRTCTKNLETEMIFFELCSKYFNISPIPIEEHHEFYRSDDITIIQMTQKINL